MEQGVVARFGQGQRALNEVFESRLKAGLKHFDGAAMRKQNGGHSDLLEIQARIPAGGAALDGDLMIPSGASGIAVFAHGSGSSRHSPRNRSVARVIREAGVGTLLFDLLTREEESVDVFTRRLRFDIDLLTAGLVGETRWLAGQTAAWVLG